MISNLSKAGRSFKGAYLYLMHDVKASTRERVAWTQTENMLTENPDKAWKVMAYTALVQDQLKEASGMSRAGRKTEKPVQTFSLAWHPEQDPDQDEMLTAARKAITTLGLSEHEALIVAHRDTPHKHVHVMVNLIHPITGRVETLSHSKRKLSALSHQLELEGGKIYCQQRKDNQDMQKKSISTQYRDPIIQEAWNTTKTGQDFTDALAAQSYYLARGRKRLVVVDRHGKTHNPVRHIEGVRAKEFNAKLADVDPAHLRDANDVAREVSEHKQGQYRQHLQHSENLSSQLADMQSRHFDEQSDLLTTHRRTKLDEERELEHFYDFKAQATRIEALERRCEKPKWWRKITGLHKRDLTRLEERKLSLTDGRTRFQDRMDHLKVKKSVALAELQAKQDGERLELLKCSNQLRPIKQLPQIEFINEPERLGRSLQARAPSLRM